MTRVFIGTFSLSFFVPGFFDIRAGGINLIFSSFLRNRKIKKEP